MYNLHLKKKSYSQLVPLGIILFLGLATLLTFIVSQQRQDLRSKALTDSAILSFSPTSVTTTANGTFNVAVILNTTPQAAVGTDILVQFDSTKLTLTNITKSTHTVFNTWAPIVANDTNGTFDIQRVKDCANLGTFINNTQNCPSGAGVAEFGVVAFNWANNALTGSFAGVISPLATLTFQAKTGSSGTTSVSYKFIDLNTTTDSNVVANPVGSGNPEDILAAPTSTVAVTISTTTTASPTPTPTPTRSPSPTPSQVPTPTPTRSPSPTPTPTRSPSPTPTRSPSPTPTRSPSPTPSINPTPTPGSGAPQVVLQVNLEGMIGVTTQKPDKDFTVVFKKAAIADQVFTSVFNATANNGNVVYTNQSPFPVSSPDTYSIYVKAPSYLVRQFANITISTGAQTINLNNLILAGDALSTGISTNKIDIYDYNNLVANYNCKPAPASPPPGKLCNSFNSDFDYDTDVDIFDYNFMIGNFGAIGD